MAGESAQGFCILLHAALYTVGVVLTLWAYTVGLHCGLTLCAYTVGLHCGLTLWAYTVGLV